MGQPTKYREGYVAVAGAMCKLGAVDKDLAAVFEVDLATISNWKVTHEAFFDALNTNKPGYDDQVQRSLAQRAIGYSHPETKVNVVDGKIIETTVIKYYPPETKACLAWLYNRRGAEWHPNRDNSDTDKAMPKSIKIEIVNASKDAKR